MATQASQARVTLFVAIFLFAFGTFLVLAEDPICDTEKCDWEVQYCCGNNTCCNWKCDSSTNTSSCKPKTEFCCGNNTCCEFDCKGGDGPGCKKDQFCCGRKPSACCSDGLWHAVWWTWLLVCVILLVFILSVVYVWRSKLRKSRAATYRGTDPYESGDEKSFESSMKQQPSAGGLPNAGPVPYQSL